jgi:paraquat-inducible protein B
MNRAKRGVALVINIQTYTPNAHKLKERVWSIKDVENLQHTLEYLEFEFKLCQNSTKAQIEQEIKRQASSDHSHSDCFLCVVMSHGNKDKIVASDREEISFEEIMAPIKSKCSSLENKPKMFFFQACRGDNEMEAKKQRADSRASTSSGHEPTDHIDDETNNNNNNNKIHAPKQNTQMENESDLLVYYSTIEGQVSSGNVAEGTIFIKNVCKQLNEAYKNLPNNMSLDAMIKNINESVKGSAKQLAEALDRFSGTVHFKPKNVSFDRIE